MAAMAAVASSATEAPSRCSAVLPMSTSTPRTHGSASVSRAVQRGRRRSAAPDATASAGSSIRTKTEALSSEIRTARTSPSETMSDAPSGSARSRSAASRASLSTSITSDCFISIAASMAMAAGAGARGTAAGGARSPSGRSLPSGDGSSAEANRHSGSIANERGSFTALFSKTGTKHWRLQNKGSEET
eukprot:scaffold1212_cov90-Isochrysis_galbana.AAC.2